MDLGRLKVFYTLVKAGSFTKAARILNISQPAVTHSLQIFEYSIKAKLINRSTRGFTLTSEGERVFELASRVIQETEHFWETFRSQENEIQGEIKIITTPSVGETELTHYLLPYVNVHPKLRIQILTTFEEFDDQQADVAIRSFIPNRPDLEQLPLQTFHLKLWASPEYLAKFGTPQSTDDLEKHRLLVFNFDKFSMYHRANLINWILHVGNHSDKIREPFFRITSHQGLYNAAKAGYGIIQLPKETIKLRGYSLIPVLPDLEEPQLDLSFICNKKLLRVKRISALYQYLHECFNNGKPLED